MARCRSEAPALKEIAPRRRSACHLNAGCGDGGPHGRPRIDASFKDEAKAEHERHLVPAVVRAGTASNVRPDSAEPVS